MSKFFFILLLALGPACFADGPKYQFTGSVSLGFAEHLTNPIDPASENGYLFLKQRVNFSAWTIIASGQGWVEGVYRSENYPAPLRNQDSSDVRFQDTYVQYKSNHWRVRLGNQTVVWGETLGGSFTDIVNPKDLRNGFTLDLSQIALASPMANVEFLTGPFSFQGLFIPVAKFNILPLPGSDYFPSFKIPFFHQLEVNRQLDLPWSEDHAEFGGRVSQTIGTADLSLLGLSYNDRNAYYLVGDYSISDRKLYLDEHHARVNSFGESIAWSIESIEMVLREEGLITPGRVLTAIGDQGQLTTQTTTETAGALSLDFPKRHGISSTLQYAISHVSDSANYLTRYAQNQDTLSVHLSVELFRDSSWNNLLGATLYSQGFHYQSEFMTPLTSGSELRVGVEAYSGDINNQFGSIQRANQVYVKFRAFLPSFKVSKKPRR